MIVFGFDVEDAGVLDLDVMFQVDVPCHDSLAYRLMVLLDTSVS
jgi:hypothetical protein